MSLRNLLFCAMAIFPALIHADTVSADQKAIDPLATVRQFLATELPPLPEGRREIQITSPDPRMVGSSCASSLQAFWPSGAKPLGAFLTVGIRCTEPAWQVFINAQSTEWQQVWVSRRLLARGHVLSAGDLEQKDVRRGFLRGQPVADPEPLLGSRVRQAMAAGEPLTAKHVCHVCRGEPVDILAGDEQFAVAMAGVAEADAAIGEQVRVRNLSSRRSIAGQVTAANKIRVN